MPVYMLLKFNRQLFRATQSITLEVCTCISLDIKTAIQNVREFVCMRKKKVFSSDGIIYIFFFTYRGELVHEAINDVYVQL